MSKKVEYTQNLQSLMTDLGQVMDVSSERVAAYNNRGYGSGGADELMDQDIASTGLTANDVLLMVNALTEYEKFTKNQAIIVGDYQSTINRTRTDLK